jgi:hypothetical protein
VRFIAVFEAVDRYFGYCDHELSVISDVFRCEFVNLLTNSSQQQYSSSIERRCDLFVHWLFETETPALEKSLDPNQICSHTYRLQLTHVLSACAHWVFSIQSPDKQLYE